MSSKHNITSIHILNIIVTRALRFTQQSHYTSASISRSSSGSGGLLIWFLKALNLKSLVQLGLHPSDGLLRNERNSDLIWLIRIWLERIDGRLIVSLPQIFRKPVPSGDYTRRQSLCRRCWEVASEVFEKKSCWRLREPGSSLWWSFVSTRST